MIINPVAAAAAVAARAFTGFMPVARRPNYVNRPPPEAPETSSYHDDYDHDHHQSFTTNQYFPDMEEDINDQARELDDFVTSNNNMNMPPHIANTPPVQDAEILSKEQTIKHQSQQTNSRKPPPPPLPDTNNPFILLGLQPGATFDDARRAYKEMAKLYHPDIALGPDASADERQVANWDFARINAAFDILKRKENEEVLEYTVFENGEHVARSHVVSEESRRRDPHAINYDRIREMTEYRERHPKERLWYEEDHEYYHEPQRHKDFYHDDDNDNNSNDGYDSYSRGKWWTGRRDGFGHIPSNEKRWEERLQDRGENRHGNNGFGVNSSGGDQWGNERNAFFDYEAHGSTSNGNYNYQNEYHNGNSQSYDNAEMKQGYPYKETVLNERSGFGGGDASDYRPSADTDTAFGGYDYDPQEKWWRANDPTIGDFSP